MKAPLPFALRRLPALLVAALPLSIVHANAVSIAPPAPVAETTVVLAGHLIAEPGEPTLGAHTLVIRDGRVARLQPGLEPNIEPGARVIDLSDAHVLPGLIDVHMHLAIDSDVDPVTFASPARMALATAAYARRLLRAGITTVRDVGDNSGVTYAVRDAIDRGDLQGPRILAAGRIVSRSGGHGAKRAGPGEIDYAPAACDGSESCRRAVRENIEDGADWIKLTVSGSGREAGGQPQAAPDMFEDEVESAVAAARQAGRPVAAHAHSTAAINLALRSGARTIEHGTYFDDASVALFKKHRAYLVPTAFVADHVASKLSMFAGGRDGRGPEDLRRWTEAAKAGPGRAWRAGVPLALGTDGGPSFEPSATAREIALYAESGVPLPQALRAATVGNADALGLGAELGRLRTGYRADLIAVAGDPQRDASYLQGMRMVMKHGHIACLRDCAEPAAESSAPAPSK
ncbi:amidohydrolase family protein [Lysobacter sp. CA199]|uniref:amidohydrolase family protein n=1 Tax=Lysobacter sp. CA199 TaxID=3455608 RepID=UPI003F8D871A